MQKVKKTPDYSVYQKKSGRYAVKGKDKQWLHGDAKSAALLSLALIEPPKQKVPPAEEPPAAEGEADAPQPES
jgi:hypothetical protein